MKSWRLSPLKRPGSLATRVTRKRLIATLRQRMISVRATLIGSEPGVRSKRSMTFLPSKIPLIQAPMAGAQGPDLAIAVCRAGGLGSLPSAMLTPALLREQIAAVRGKTEAPVT
jgi:IMP dehydrogenase/GMP reductase